MICKKNSDFYFSRQQLSPAGVWCLPDGSIRRDVDRSIKEMIEERWFIAYNVDEDLCVVSDKRKQWKGRRLFKSGHDHGSYYLRPQPRRIYSEKRRY